MTPTIARPQQSAPVRVKNASCPKCDGPIFYDPENWLTCGGRCGRKAQAGRRAIRFALSGQKGGAA